MSIGTKLVSQEQICEELRISNSTFEFCVNSGYITPHRKSLVSNRVWYKEKDEDILQERLYNSKEFCTKYEASRIFGVSLEFFEFEFYIRSDLEAIKTSYKFCDRLYNFCNSIVM